MLRAFCNMSCLPGEIHKVTALAYFTGARGIERRKIFKDDKDRKAFLERLAIILEETQTQCYAWSLIPNHFHLLLRTGLTPLSKVMRRLMTGYAVTFNRRHKRSGHLFQNRYKSVTCEEDPYLLELIRYIHLNPLRAKLVQELKEPDKYPWTGHSALLGKRKDPLAPEVRNRKSGVRNYRTSNQADQSPWDNENAQNSREAVWSEVPVATKRASLVGKKRKEKKGMREFLAVELSLLML